MTFPYEEFDLSDVRTYPLASRPSKVRIEDFGRPCALGASVASLLSSLPDILAGADFKAIVAAMARARLQGHGIVWGIGGHVIKTGLTPVLIDLMERGLVSALATNGAAIIHDFEIAHAGATSEDVDEALGPGRFGMAEETGRVLNLAINHGSARGLGVGQSVSQFLVREQPPFVGASLFAAAGRLGVPVTVHLAIGTDVSHMHPSASGSALGEGSLRDFRYFVANVSRLAHGVFLNCGSAVILPEVFLKAVALVRNRGVDLTGLTTVNLDFTRAYRPSTNVVTRPTAGVGRGYSIIGHHELMIPFLAASVIEACVKPVAERPMAP